MPNSYASLLPPNANTTERRLEQAMAFDTPLRPLVQSLHQLRTNKPSAIAPWLAGEWGIGSFAKHFANTADFYDETLAHLKMRGTAAAVKKALGWVHQGSASLDVENFYLHIHLATPFHGNWDDFNHLVNYSIPLHLDYYRVTSGDDGRHGVYDTRNYDDAVYDSDAGVLIDGVLVNYVSTYRATTNITVSSAISHAAVTAITSIERTWRTIASWGNEPWATSTNIHMSKQTL